MKTVLSCRVRGAPAVMGFLVIVGLLIALQEAVGTCGPTGGEQVAQQPLPCSTVGQFTRAMLSPSVDNEGEVDDVLSKLDDASRSGYSWADYYLYCAAVHACKAEHARRALELLDRYLDRLAAR